MIAVVPFSASCSPAVGPAVGAWVALSDSSGEPPGGRPWVWVAVSGTLDLGLSDDGGATVAVWTYQLAGGAFPTRLAVPAGYSLWARHPGDDTDTRTAFASWSEE